jgi:DNA-binding Lrp family transcriptional regulator
MSDSERHEPRRATPAQLKALASPIRIELVGQFQSHGPMAIRELAEKTGRPADGLYHHVRQLLKVGILKEAESRRIGRRDEVVFGLTQERFGHEQRPASPAMKRAIVETAAAALRLTSREFERSVISGPSAQNDSENCPVSHYLSRQKSWLTDEDRKRLLNKLRQIETFLSKRLRRKRGQPFVLTTVLVPQIKRKRV